jgi:hypothetical protein
MHLDWVCMEATVGKSARTHRYNDEFGFCLFYYIDSLDWMSS